MICNYDFKNTDVKLLYNDKYFYAPSEVSEKEKIFQDNLSAKLEKIIKLKNKNVLEIGCGDGYFLNRLRYFASECIGYDPSAAFEKAKLYESLIIKKEMFSFDNISTNTDLYVMRHVLEHLEYPIKFLKNLHRISKNNKNPTYLYIEVPNINFCIDSNMYFDFYYDHIFYFNKFSLCKILESTGWFPFRSVFSDKNEFLGIVSKNILNNSHKKLEFYLNDKVVDRLYNFKTNFLNWKTKLISLLDNIKNKRKSFAVWGTGARGVSLLSNINLDIYKPLYFIDSDKSKIGLYPSVGEVKIKPPEFVYDQFADFIMISSYTFFDEIADSLQPYLSRGGKLIKLYPDPTIV